MRKSMTKSMTLLSASLLATPLLFAAVPALAQSADPAVDEYKCIFAGQCEDQEKPTEEPEQKAPETKGFKLAAPSAGGAPKPPVAQATKPAQKDLGVGRGKTPETAKSFALGKGATPKATKGTPQGKFALGSGPGSGGATTPRANLQLSFTVGSAQLDSVGLRRAKVFAEALKTDALKDKRFVIEGHTDSSGGRAKNLDLSQRRAQAVADLLAAEGVDASRLEVKGLAYDRPLPGKRASSPANRRVEAVLAK